MLNSIISQQLQQQLYHYQSYILQGHLARHTLFPCPDPVLGKGVLVQTTLWGNLILGPTARDMHLPEARSMSAASIQEYILSKCKALVPSFDPKETIHAFAGARAKSDRGDWIIEPSKVNNHFIHVAGIDSPGLAGSPASKYNARMYYIWIYCLYLNTY
jgi:glycerol-3-phosphate dehydrogenase